MGATTIHLRRHDRDVTLCCLDPSGVETHIIGDLHPIRVEADPSREMCDLCSAAVAEPRRCPECNGEGGFVDDAWSWNDCSRCGGFGSLRTCPRCSDRNVTHPDWSNEDLCCDACLAHEEG